MANNIVITKGGKYGVITKDGAEVIAPKYESLNLKLEEISKKYGVTKSAIAVSWILRHPANITPVVGTTSIGHLKEMLKAKAIKLTREEWYSLYLASEHILP